MKGKALEECFISATALNLKRLVKAVRIIEFISLFMSFQKSIQNEPRNGYVVRIYSVWGQSLYLRHDKCLQKEINVWSIDT